MGRTAVQVAYRGDDDLRRGLARPWLNGDNGRVIETGALWIVEGTDMAEKQALDFNSELESRGAAAYLEAMAQGLRNGHLVIASGDQAFTIEVPDNLKLSIDAAASVKGKNSIEISLSWRENKKATPAPSNLYISSTPIVEQQESGDYVSDGRDE